jgi:polyketide biosynthesis enoyl-CoA hydratase PksI
VSGDLQLSTVAEGVASLRISDDADPYFRPVLLDRLRGAAALLARDDAIRVVLLEGGSRYFSAGASRESLVAETAAALVPAYAAELPRLVLSLPVPSVAAMAGHAVGGGFLLGLWCDLPVIAEEALYGANFMALGLTPGMGATALLEEALGAARGRELLISGRLVKGRELRGAPGVHSVVPRDMVRDTALGLARDLAAGSRDALLLLKQILAARRRERLERALPDEQAAHAALLSRAETRSRIAERYPASPFGGARRDE